VTDDDNHVVLEDNLAVINVRNTFYIKYYKKTFLSRFWAKSDSFDVSDSFSV